MKHIKKYNDSDLIEYFLSLETKYDSRLSNIEDHFKHYIKIEFEQPLNYLDILKDVYAKIQMLREIEEIDEVGCYVIFGIYIGYTPYYKGIYVNDHELPHFDDLINKYIHAIKTDREIGGKKRLSVKELIALVKKTITVSSITIVLPKI